MSTPMSQSENQKIVNATERTAKSTHFIAIIVGIFATLTLIGMLVIGIQVGHALNVLDGPATSSAPSFCQSQGGSIPGC